MKVNVPKVCMICLSKCSEKGEEEYYGGVGDCVCVGCGRDVCPLHFNHTKALCLECFLLLKSEKK